MEISSKETISMNFGDLHLIAGLGWIFKEDKNFAITINRTGAEYKLVALCGKYSYCCTLRSQPPPLAIGTWTFEIRDWKKTSSALDKIFDMSSAPVEFEVYWQKWIVVAPAIGLIIPTTLLD